MARFTFLQFLASQWAPVPPVETADLSGKTVLVVGANIGLGYEAAKHFASMKPAKLVLGCRTEEKGRRAVESIRKATGFDGVEARVVDLANFQSVVSFAEGYMREGNRLDIYVYNAAVAVYTYAPTVDGWETTLQVNDLSCMLLSVLLLPCMLKSAGPSWRPRAVVVSSEVHYWSTLKPDELASTSLLEKLNNKSYCTRNVMSGRYELSKLLNVFFVRELAARLPQDSPLIVNAVNPGFCKSGLARNLPFLDFIGHSAFQLFTARTSEQGSRMLVWAAIGGRNREAELHGAYVSDAGVMEVSDFVLSNEGADTQKRLWEESTETLSLVSPTFKTVIQDLLR
ncbi:short-chain dehydrogenase [Artomyces pyxidatus]|uniref:Short-chain dehydrogenase n=1 Tax=Artomyces pyxidatus TaxID=48021 RepID=A0ACB8TL80_9AGAM|nr:short-chain dehydrogenase [Artomyces pyxidatus]